MNITEIWKNPKFSMSAMVRRMAEREAEKVIEMARQAHADDLAETMRGVIRMDRELDLAIEEVAPITERLTSDFHEMFPDSGDVA